jgi:pimeloyl-CoA synthetase
MSALKGRTLSDEHRAAIKAGIAKAKREKFNRPFMDGAGIKRKKRKLEVVEIPLEAVSPNVVEAAYEAVDNDMEVLGAIIMGVFKAYKRR